MALAIFDLDNTLLAGDSDYEFGEFLVKKQWVEESSHRDANELFYQQYQQGNLDINAYLRFALSPLAGKSAQELDGLHQEFMQSIIRPLMLDAAKDLIKQHREAGDHLMIITATNRFITAPIAAAFGIETLLASDAEIINGSYTGQPTGTPCFQAGKITRLQDWLAQPEQQSLNLAGAYFYSDSFNDIPLLELVDHPVAVDADDTLKAHALTQGWPCISLRD